MVLSLHSSLLCSSAFITMLFLVFSVSSYFSLTVVYNSIICNAFGRIFSFPHALTVPLTLSVFESNDIYINLTFSTFLFHCLFPTVMQTSCLYQFLHLSLNNYYFLSFGYTACSNIVFITSIIHLLVLASSPLFHSIN